MTSHMGRLAVVITLAIGVSLGGSAAVAQDAATPDQAPFERVQTPFASGVLNQIPPAPQPKETFSGPFRLAELQEMHPEISWTSDSHPDGRPHFEARSRTLIEMAKQVTFRREVFCLEFSFKPLRQILMDLPVGNGRTQRKLVTYMVYRLRYRGGDLRPATEEVGRGELYKRIEAVGYESRRAFPILVLENHESKRKVVDRIIPAAKARIATREQIQAPLYNTVDIARVKIPRTTDPDAPGIWGVATWTDLDPDLDFFSVNVFGLTNAFEMDGLDKDAPYRRKALSLNFFRPGDSMAQTEDRVRFGIPAYSDADEQETILTQYGVDERLDYRWIFR